MADLPPLLKAALRLRAETSLSRLFLPAMDDTNHSPLSPSAQTVLDAANRAYAQAATVAQGSAAALRAVADQGENFYDPHEGKTSAVRTDWILAIAAELEGHHG